MFYKASRYSSDVQPKNTFKSLVKSQITQYLQIGSKEKDFNKTSGIRFVASCKWLHHIKVKTVGLLEPTRLI